MDTNQELYTIGLKYYEHGEYGRAVDTFEKVISRESNFADAYYHQGNAYIKPSSGAQFKRLGIERLCKARTRTLQGECHGDERK